MRLVHGDCQDVLKTIPDNSVDALVTDPPAGISFMGKGWDGDKGGRKEWCAWMEGVMRECLRVMKPGAHGLVWALPRTSHWTATALEDAGLEIRDCVYHLFGSGFPKSLDVSKAIDENAYREYLKTHPECVEELRRLRAAVPHNLMWEKNPPELDIEIAQALEAVKDYEWEIRKAAGAVRPIAGPNPSKRPNAYVGANGWETPMRPDFKTGPATDAAKQWQGFGTALKPAVECWWLIRKPLSEKTVAANVLKWGTGALNIDESRIGSGGHHGGKTGAGNSSSYDLGKEYVRGPNQIYTQGRFPSHLLLSHSPHCSDTQCDIECAIQMLDAQSGNLGKSVGGNSSAIKTSTYGMNSKADGKPCGFGDSGGASRFFYCAKISSSERNAGLEGMEAKSWKTHGFRDNETTHLSPRAGAGRTRDNQNTHPTVKPQKLMRYLCKLITPPGGIVLDPFMGSGSTGLAAQSEGFGFIGIEREQEYFEIAQKRVLTPDQTEVI